MKPRTKNEKEVDRLAKSLPALTDAQIKWIHRNAVPATAYQYNQTSAWCSNCGHIFDDSHNQGKCPHCGAKFDKHVADHPRKTIFKGKWYTTIITTCGRWQVSRHYLVQHHASKGGEQRQAINEAVQIWTNAQGEQVIYARPTHMCGFYYDVWNFDKPMSIKQQHYKYGYRTGKYDIYSYSNKVCRVLPILKRNGFVSAALDAVSPDDLFPLILKDNFAETLLKTKQYGLLGLYTTSRGIKKEIAKICLRHGYHIKIDDAKMWRDYIDMCEELGKDIHNPQVCCPADLKAAHDRMARIKQRKEEKERLERLEKQHRGNTKGEQKFIKSHKKFFGLMIVGKNLNIFPLKCIDDFINEGAKMHHCVAGYYQHDNSLILSARDSKGKRIETIEIDLRTFKIVQSQGVCNQPSKRHDEIVKLMNKHMGEVMALAQPKKKSANKPARARQAA